jgi:anti-anti-sigma regulatory factor
MVLSLVQKLRQRSGTMTLRIERRRSEDRVVVQLIGEFDTEHLDEVQAQLNDAPCPVVIDIGELTLISVDGIRFLNACHDHGLPIINASGYIVEWMTLEGQHEPKR